MSPVAAEFASAESAPAPGPAPAVVDDEALAVCGEWELVGADEPQPAATSTRHAYAITTAAARSTWLMLQAAPELLLNSASPPDPVGAILDRDACFQNLGSRGRRPAPGCARPEPSG